MQRSTADEAQITEHSSGVHVVTGGVGIDGRQAVDVDSNVVVVDVAELSVEDGIELDGEEVAGRVSVGVEVEEAEELAGESAR